MMPHQSLHFGAFAGNGARNGRGYKRNTNPADRMIVFLAEVIDLRAGRSIPFNAAEDVIFFTVAVPKTTL